MLNKTLIVVFLLYLFSPASLFFILRENVFSGIEYHDTEITQLEEIKIVVEEKFIPQSLLRGEDMTMFYFRNIRPTLPDYNKNYRPVVVKPKQKSIRTN
jgi:hypothetical protein